MGRAVVADEPGAVHREDHVELLQADVVDDLVVGPLQEGRVDRHDRLDPLEGEPRGEQHRLLLGDADVEVAVGHRLLQDRQAGARVHRRRDADHALVPFAFLHEGVAEHLRVLRRRGLRRAVGLGPGRGAVEDRVGLGGVPLLHALEAAFLGGREALALDRRDVHDHRALRGQSLTQGRPERFDVVSVDHAHVGPVELLPPKSRRPEGLDRLLQVRPEALEGRADADRQPRQAPLDLGAGVPQLGVQADAVEVARQRADVGCDRHAVVVEHDHDRRAEAARLADRLEGDPAGHRAVPDHGHDLAVLARAALAHALLDADGVADRRRGVARAHDVVRGLGDRAEGREPAVLADRR